MYILNKWPTHCIPGTWYFPVFPVFSLVFHLHIFPHLGLVPRVTPYIPVFSPNARKYRPEKTPYLYTFHAVLLI